jgi:PAS domain-containing protein
MHRHALKLLTITLALALTVGAAAAARVAHTHRAAAFALLAANGVAAACLALLVWRARAFHRRLSLLLRRLLGGLYETGIPPRPGGRDELDRLERALNRFVDQLRSFDEQRARRVACAHHALALLVRSVREPLIMVDPRQRKFTLNAAAQRLFGVAEDTYGLEAIEPLADNQPFMDRLRAATETDRSPQEARVCLQLPPREARREFLARMLPVKAWDDRVEAVVIFLLDATEPSSSPSPHGAASAASHALPRP